MGKKTYVMIELLKLFALSLLIHLVYQEALANSDSFQNTAVIGASFLLMLGTVIIAAIILDIAVSFFTPKEKRLVGEWERWIGRNILRNFAYTLSVFFVGLMAAFALQASQAQILLLLRLGFFLLIAVTNLTKAYYYVG